MPRKIKGERVLKKWKMVIGLIILAVCIWVIYLAGNNLKETKGGDLKPLVMEEGSLKIYVDPRIELLTSVQLNGDYKILGELDYKYRNDMKKYFQQYKKHKAVKKFIEMQGYGFSYDAPPKVMLHLSPLPSLEKVVPFEEDTIIRAGGEENLKEFTSALKDYANKSKFNDFYVNNSEFYKTIVNNTYSSIKGLDLSNKLESYYGIKHNSYNLIIAPLIHSGGYGPKVKRPDGSWDIFAIIGPTEVDNNIPKFDTETIKYLVWHEFGHSFVNPITKENYNEISKYSNLFSPITEKMQKQAYANWETCVNEHVVRAVTIRLTERYEGKEKADRLIKMEKADGFFYIEPICNKLVEYEENRDRYKNFEDFYPEIITVFKELSEKKLGPEFYRVTFEGPINNAFQLNKSVVYITPTNEKDSEIQSRIEEYVEKVRDGCFKNAEIITDVEALNRNLSDKTLIVYGTINGNLYLAKYKEEFPFKLENDKIIADTEYKGNDLRFITAFPNPQDKYSAMIIYTAQRSENIIDINSVFHGGYDYVIAKGRTILKEKDYIKREGIWEVK